MSDKIPLIDPVVGDEELSNIKSVLDSGYLSQGPYAKKMENKFASMVDTTHAIATTSCTTGMELALEGLGIGDGDEVIVPNFTYPATATAVTRVGASPVLVDVDRQTYNISTEEVAEAITDDTAAILPVAWGGQPLDHVPLQSIANEHGLVIIEDAACSAKASFDAQPVGSQFNVSVFSLHPRKVLTTGEGGIITTDNGELAREIRSIKNFGTDPMGDRHGFFKSDATNYRFSDILAAVGVAQIEKADKIIDRRREVAARYDELLADLDGVTAPAVVDGGKHNYQSYCAYIEVGNSELRDELIDAMADEGIETQIGTYALHDTEAFSDAKQFSSLENSTALQENLLTLPIAHSITEAQQQRVVNTLEAEINERI
jgi:dTDP-4-amino-4,6-dideoxygalactose transaminase